LNQKLFVLDRNYQCLTVLDPTLPQGFFYFDDIHTEALEHGLLTLEFSVPANHPEASHLVAENYVVYPTLDNEFQLLKMKKPITSITADGQHIKRVFAENAAVSDLLGTIVRPTKLNSYTLEQAMEYVLAGSGWELGKAEYSGVKDFDFTDYITALDAVHQILDEFGAEIKFTVEFVGLTVVRKTIDVLLARGEKTLKPFVYSIDLEGVEKHEDTDDLVTALIGVGPSRSDGSYLTFSSYTPPAEPGYEKVDDWVGSLDALQQWGNGGKHIFGVYKDDNAQNAVELYNRTLAKLKELSKPLYTYKVDVITLERITGYEAHRVRVGDEIVIKDTTFQPELILRARVIERRTSKRDPTQDQVILGEYRPIMATQAKFLQRLQGNIRDALNTARQGAGTGAHVIVNGPKPLVNGNYRNFKHSMFIEVTENVHLASASIFCETDGQSGIVELRRDDNTTIERREFSELVAGENRISLNFLLLKEIGKYRLYGEFSGNTWRTTTGLIYPYDSGTFKVTGSTSSEGYWYFFYDISAGGSGVNGAYGQELRLGDQDSRYGKIVAYSADGETTAIIDDSQITLGSVVASSVQAPNLVTSGIPAGTIVSYYVNATTGEDGNDGSSTSPFASVAAAIQRIPRVFDGEVQIHLQSDIVEDITFSGFLGTGKIKVMMNGYTMTGTFLCQSVKLRVSLLGGTETSTTIYGRINAKSGETVGVIQAFQSDYVEISYVKAYGNGGTNGCTGVLTSYDNSFVYCSFCEFYNARSACVYSAYGGKTMLVNCVGSGADYGVMADYAGFIGWSTKIPDGTGNPIRAINGGMVNPSSVGSGQSGGGTGGTTPTAPTVTVWNSSSGDSWRTVFNEWRGDGKVVQGMWRSQYGHHTGIWLFPSSLSSTVAGKTIKRIRCYLRRLTGGNATVTITIRMHGYASKPTGQPSVLPPTCNVSFGTGDAKWVDLPSSWFPYFSSGTTKGIGLYTSNTTSSYYAVFDDSAKIEITYV
jgi:phage minor structural protein